MGNFFQSLKGPPFNFFHILQPAGVSQSPKGPPFYIFRHCDTVQFIFFHILPPAGVSQNPKSPPFTILSLRYSADFGRSRLVLHPKRPTKNQLQENWLNIIGVLHSTLLPYSKMTQIRILLLNGPALESSLLNILEQKTPKCQCRKCPKRMSKLEKRLSTTENIEKQEGELFSEKKFKVGVLKTKKKTIRRNRSGLIFQSAWKYIQLPTNNGREKS